MTFDAAMLGRTWEPVSVPPGLSFSPQRWAWDHHYGPYTATVEVSGSLNDLWHTLSWLRYGIEIINDDSEAVWWGFVNEVQLQTGALSWNASLEDMYNAVTVLYSYVDIDGNETTGETSTTTDVDSIAMFGRKEILRTTSDIDSAQADYFRDQILSERKNPVATPTPSTSKARAILHCRGYAHAYSWILYSNDAGKIEHASTADRMQKIGWGYTSTNIGFNSDYRMHDIDGRFADLTTDDNIRITGSVSNNASRAITETDDRAQETYSNTTISFETTDDIKDSNRNLGFITTYDMIEISGASTGAHNDFHIVNHEDDAHIELNTGWNTTISNESAGNNVTIKVGGRLKTGTAGTDEVPGNSITITAYGERVAQSFTNSTGSAWTVDSISLYLQKIGTPTDDLTVKLYTDSAGAPNTLIESITLDGADIGTEANWIEVSFSNTNSISNSTLYWIVLERTGANDYDDYFVTGVTDGDEYTGGSMLLYDGSAYIAATADDMMFRVWGGIETTTQISDMLGDANLTAMDAVDIVHLSSINSMQYRGGERSVLDEVADLVALGDSNGDPFSFEVTRDRVARVKIAPTEPVPASYLLSPQGKLLDVTGQPLPRGKCLVAQWVDLVDVPPHVGVMALQSPMYITRCDYDARTDTAIPTARGAPNPFDVGRVTR